MPYRPHFAYATPPGFVDELADYPFDYRNTGLFSSTKSVILNGAVALDSDAPFLWRSTIYEIGDGAPEFFLAGSVCARFKDAYGNYLMDNFVPLLILAQPYYVLQPWTGVNAATPPAPGPFFCAPVSMGMGVPLVNELRCPASSTLTVDLLLLNPTFGGTSVSVGRLIARGVKRRPKGDCQEYGR